MKHKRIDRDQAEAMAVEALVFISADPILLPRFLSLTGITISDIRAAAAEPGFLAGVLQFIAAHEPTLVDFASAAGIQPAEIMEALRVLPTGDSNYEHST